MKTTTSKLVNYAFDLEPFVLEISIQYSEGLVLKAIYEIDSNVLRFNMSQNDFKINFYPSEIKVIQEMINDAREISKLNMDYDEKIWGSYAEWANEIHAVINETINMNKN